MHIHIFYLNSIFINIMVKKPAALQKVQFLKVMKTLNNHQRSVIIDFLDDYGVDIICDCIYNTIYQDHGLKKSSKKRLRKILKGKEQDMQIVSKKSNNIKRRKKILGQQLGGNPLAAILGIALPILTQLLFKGK